MSNFIDELSRSTETKGQSTYKGFDLSESDFAAETTATQASEPIAVPITEAPISVQAPIAAPVQVQTPVAVQVPEKPSVKLSSNLTSRILVKTLDDSLCKGLGFLVHSNLLKKKCFADNADHLRCEKAYVRSQNATTQLDGVEIEAAARYEVYDQKRQRIKQKLSLTPEEIADAQEVLGMYCDETDLGLPPWLGLVMSLSQIVLSRIFIDDGE